MTSDRERLARAAAAVCRRYSVVDCGELAALMEDGCFIEQFVSVDAAWSACGRIIVDAILSELEKPSEGMVFAMKGEDRALSDGYEGIFRAAIQSIRKQDDEG